MRFVRLAMQGAAIAVTMGCLLTGTSVWAAGSSSSDSDISTWVREALKLDPRIDSMQVGIETEQGIVTLSGVVTSLAEKSYAVAEAKKISGVRGVVDDVLVSATLLPDREILDYVKDRLASSSIVGPGVSATAADGTVYGQLAASLVNLMQTAEPPMTVPSVG